jgi:hypothetical protein
MMPRYVLLVAAEAEADNDIRNGPEMRARHARYLLARRLESVALALRNGQDMGLFHPMTDTASGVFLLKEVDDDTE